VVKRYSSVLVAGDALCGYILLVLLTLVCFATPMLVFAETSSSFKAGEPEADPVHRENPLRPIERRSISKSGGEETSAGWKYLQLSMPKLGLGASCELTDDRRTDGASGNETITENQEFNEWVELDVDGSIYHPALMSFSQYMKFEWRQLESELNHEPAAGSSGFLTGYDSSVTLLKDKPYTLNVYARRDQDTFSSPFVSRTETDTTQFGADFRLRYFTMPTVLSYTHSDTQQKGFYNSTDAFETVELQTSVAGITYNGSYEDRHRTTDETFVSDVQSTDHYLRGRHIFDADRHIQLNSLASYRHTDSDKLDYATSDVTERLIWKHTKTFESDYEARHQRSIWDESESRSTSAQARITHVLYENLVTRLSGSYAKEDFDRNTEVTYGGLLDLGYNRRIPGGHLYISTSNAYEVMDRNIVELMSQITDEPHVLTTGAVTLLNRRNIDADTIVVTDPTGSVIYIDEIDYRITTLENSVRIRRLPLGAIADGGTVMISYSYLSNPAYDSSIYTQSYDVRLFLWSALTLSYRYHSADERLLSGIPPENDSDMESWGAGMNWIWRWTETSIDFDDTFTDSGVSTSRWRLEESLTLRPTRSLFWGIRGWYSKTDFKASDDTEDAYGVNANQDWRPIRWCTFELQAAWREINGSFEESTDLEIEAGVRISYRIWNFRINYRLIDNEDRLSHDSRREQVVFIELFRRRW
jgi:hypothetical protein